MNKKFVAFTYFHFVEKKKYLEKSIMNSWHKLFIKCCHFWHWEILRRHISAANARVLNLKSIRGTRKDNKNFRANSGEGHSTYCLNSELNAFVETTVPTYTMLFEKYIFDECLYVDIIFVSAWIGLFCNFFVFWFFCAMSLM